MWPIISRTPFSSTAATMRRAVAAFMGKRLFEKDGLARLGRCDRRVLMQPVRQADADRIEFGQRQQRMEIVKGPRAGGLARRWRRAQDRGRRRRSARLPDAHA